MTATIASPRQRSTSRAQPERTLARAYSQEGEWRLARNAWEPAAQSDPGDWEAQYRLCEACFWTDDPGGCAAYGERASTLRPADLRPLLYLGRAYIRMHDFLSAQPVWYRLIAADQNCYEAWVRLAQCQAQRGRGANARASLERALAIEPANPAAFPIMNLALRALAPADAQSQLAQWLARLESHRADAGTELLKHMSRRNLGLLRKVMAQADTGGEAAAKKSAPAKARSPSPQRKQQPAVPTPAKLLREARELHAGQSWENASSAWQRHLALAPDHFESHLRLGQTLVALGKPGPALEHLAEAWRIEPGDLKGLTAYSETLVAAGRKTEAIAMWRLAAASINNLTCHVRHCRFLVESGESELARDRAVEALRLVRQPDRHAVALVRILAGLGEHEAVISALQDICRRDATLRTDQQVELAARQAIALEATGRVREALDWLQAAHDEGPCHRLVVRNLVRLLGRFDRIEQALEVVERMLDRAGRELWAWHVAVDAAVALGRSREAHIYFIRACDELKLALSDWLDLAERISIPDARADILVRIRLASTDDPALLRRLSVVCFQHGDIRLALDLANRAVISDGRDPTAHATLTDIAYYNAEFERHGFDAVDVTFPDSAFELICRHIHDNPRQMRAWARTVALCNSSLAAGGAERQIAMTLRGLSLLTASKLNLHMICRDLDPIEGKDAYLANIRDYGVNVVDLSKAAEPTPAELHNLSGVEQRLIRLFEPRLRSDLIRHYVEFSRLRPHVVHLWQDRTNLVGAVAAALAGVPRIVLCARSTRPVARQRFRPFMLRAYRAVMTLPGVVLCNNSHTGAADYAAWLRQSASRTEVIHNGFDFDDLIKPEYFERAAPMREQLGLNADDLLVGGVFRIAPVKRPFLWVETAKLVCDAMPNVHFVIAGDGPLREQTEHRVRELGIADRVHFAGHVAVGPWYPTMDALLLTSVTEGLPNVVIEAHAAGVPVVSTNVGGVREIITDGRTGYALDDASAPALADRLLHVLRDASWREAAKTEARSTARARFGADTMIARTMAIYGLQHPHHKTDTSATRTAQGT